jgi:hypothetical protein
LVLGVTIVPQSDLDAYGNSFRSLQLSQANLFGARGLLCGFDRFPIQLMEEIEGRRDTLIKNLMGLACAFCLQCEDTLTSEGRASVLLNEHDLLTIPATVFGSGLLHWSVASAPPARGLTVGLLRERPDLWDTIFDDSLDGVHFIKEFMRHAGEHVLDVGCATGSVCGPLRQRGQGQLASTSTLASLRLPEQKIPAGSITLGI